MVNKNNLKQVIRNIIIVVCVEEALRLYEREQSTFL
jgi:hypothetical protein